MITIPFVQGMLTAIAILMVVGVFWAIRQVINLKHQIESLYSQIDESMRRLDLRVDVESEQRNQIVDDVHRNIDSRFDKFETRLLQEYLDK